MSFWHLFIRILFKRPVDALAALYWHLTRRKLRANNRLRATAAELPIAYELWIATVERERDQGAVKRSERLNAGAGASFTIIVEDGDPLAAEATLQSLRTQIYGRWNAFVVARDPTNAAPESGPIKWCPQSGLRDAITDAAGDYLIFVKPGSLLPPLAIFRYAEAAEQNSGATVLYGDEDQIDADGHRHNPWFKPEWNREMFLAQDYLSGAAAVATHAAREAAKSTAAGELESTTLMLRVTSMAGASIVHIPHVLCHHHACGGDPDPVMRVREVGEIVGAEGAEAVPGPFGTTKVEWPLPADLPLVSVIVPTRDQLGLLRACLTGVLERTDYRNVELIVVDNRSSDPRTLCFLSELERDPRVRVLHYPADYNFSALNNFAVKQAGGSLLCLLNNDTEVLDSGWLTEMVRYAARPEVGAVGAKLLYADGSIQHAGVAIGIGGAAGHSHRNLPNSDPGYFRQAHVAQYVTAVTAACLVVERRKFDEVGGLDETDLQVAFNDVDFCLKLRARGYRNVYVPHAVLLHHESKSRGSDAAPQNISRYTKELRVLQKRWQTQSFIDPTHSPNLDRSSERFIVGL